MTASLSTATRRSWTEYARELCADPSRLLLIPERSATDRLLQKLSDRRGALLFDRSGYRWPHPGVYRLQDYAQAILKELERCSERFQASALRLPSKIEAVKRWRELAPPGTTVLDAAEEMATCQILNSLNVGLDEWSEVLSQYESSSELELKYLTQRILRFLSYEASYAESGVTLTSNWKFLELARRALVDPAHDGYLDREFFLRLSNRPPREFHHAPTLTIPLLHELYPAERALLEALQRLAERKPDALNFEVVEATLTEDALEDARTKLRRRVEAAAPLELTNDGDCAPLDPVRFAIACTEPDHEASATEALALIPGRWPLDVSEPRKARGEPLVSCLRAALDYQSLGCPGDHRLLREQARVREPIGRFEFDVRLVAPAPLACAEFWRMLLEGLERQNPLRVEELEALRDQGDEFLSARHWLATIADQGFFDFVHPARPETDRGRLDPRGTFVGSLTESLLLGVPGIALWGGTERLMDAFDPQKLQATRDCLISPQLDRLIEALPRHLPSVTQEAHRHLAALLEFDGELRRLPAKFSHFGENAKLESDFFRKFLPSVALVDPLRLSASGISTYARCSLQYALRNLWRFEAPEEWDPQNVPRHKRGQWIHRVLELLYRETLTPEARRPWLEQEFSLRLPEIFRERSSGPYRQLIEAQIPELALQLDLFVGKLEGAWTRAGRTRVKVLTEQKFRAHQWNIQWSGTIDRVDVLDDGSLLVWDYKSGQAPKGDVEKQINKGHLQWPLYAALLESLSAEEKIALGLAPHARVVGGGYLQSLDPESSTLFYSDPSLRGFFDDAAKALACKSFEWVKERSFLLLSDEIERLKHGIQSEHFEAAPLEDAACHYCAVASFCGRPYLKLEREPGTPPPKPLPSPEKLDLFPPGTEKS